ncbi:small multidrug resistance protein [Nocardioides sp. CF8]|nr:small multidrug resistance protein [Nocardioides sp. CF8]
MLDFAEGESLRRSRVQLCDRSDPFGLRNHSVSRFNSGYRLAVDVSFPDLIAMRRRSTVARTQLEGKHTGDYEGHAQNLSTREAFTQEGCADRSDGDNACRGPQCVHDSDVQTALEHQGEQEERQPVTAQNDKAWQESAEALGCSQRQGGHHLHSDCQS